VWQPPVRQRPGGAAALLPGAWPGTARLPRVKDGKWAARARGRTGGRPPKLTEADKRKYIQAGIEEADKALALKPDYFEALTYKNLLLRSMALVEKDPGRQQALLKQADTLRDKAQELQKQKQAAAPTKRSGGVRKPRVSTAR